jgi:predicted dehydrogenase
MMHQHGDFLAGKHGDILTVEAHYNADKRHHIQPDSWKCSGEINWLYGGVSHAIDLVRWYLPDIAVVTGVGTTGPDFNRAGLPTADTMHFVMTTSGGTPARVSGCYGGPMLSIEAQSEVSCIIRGSRGISQANYRDLRYITHFDDEGPQTLSFEDRSTYYFRFEGTSHHAGEFQNYLEYFATCVAEGQAAKPDLSEGLMTVAVMQAMDKSLRKGHPVRVGELLDQHGLSLLREETSHL